MSAPAKITGERISGRTNVRTPGNIYSIWSLISLYPCYTRVRSYPFVLCSRNVIKRVEVGLKRTYLAKRWLEYEIANSSYTVIDSTIPSSDRQQTVQNGIKRLCTTFSNSPSPTPASSSPFRY